MSTLFCSILFCLFKCPPFRFVRFCSVAFRSFPLHSVPFRVFYLSVPFCLFHLCIIFHLYINQPTCLSVYLVCLSTYLCIVIVPVFNLSIYYLTYLPKWTWTVRYKLNHFNTVGGYKSHLESLWGQEKKRPPLDFQYSAPGRIDSAHWVRIFWGMELFHATKKHQWDVVELVVRIHNITQLCVYRYMYTVYRQNLKQSRAPEFESLKSNWKKWFSAQFLVQQSKRKTIARYLWL